MCMALKSCSSPRPSQKKFRPCLGEKILNFEKIVGGKPFSIFPPKISKTRVLLDNGLVIKCTDLVVEV